MPDQLLPEHPSLRHLKNQARDVLRAGAAESLAQAQLHVARSYGFASWPKLKAHVEMIEESGILRDAINRNDLPSVQAMMTHTPALHRAPIGYGKDGPLTWVAECRVPRVPPSPTRLAMAKWMIENGSDIHQGGDGPLMRAALDAERIPMMELLVALGADVNAAWHGWYPIIFAACESMNPDVMRWLLEHGADPNCGEKRGGEHPGTALDYLLGAYGRDPDTLNECIGILLASGGRWKHKEPALLAGIRGRLNELELLIGANPSLLTRTLETLDFGATAARMLTLRGGTLLHVAAEFQRLDVVRWLLDQGAGVNARATVDESGVGGQTALFHAATQNEDAGLPIVELLVERGADLTLRARVPGHYESPGEVMDCTALEYARKFPGGDGATAQYLMSQV